LQDEPTRYLFDTALIHSYISYQDWFNLVFEIRRNEHGFSFCGGQTYPLEKIAPASQRLRKKLIATFCSEDAFEQLPRLHRLYAPVDQLVQQCAHWNVLARQAPCSVKRYEHIRIGVRVPPGGDVERYLSACCAPMAYFGPGNERRLCIVVQPAAGEEGKRNAELHEAVQGEVDWWMLRREEGYFKSLYRVEQPSLEEWEKEWVDGDRFYSTSSKVSSAKLG
jgi:hypothetical protein